MLTKAEVTDLLRQEYPYLVADYGVEKIGLFGSYATGTPDEASDIDIVVEFKRPIGFRFIEFTVHLERLLGKKVDVLTRAGLQAIRVARVAQDIEENIVYV